MLRLVSVILIIYRPPDAISSVSRPDGPRHPATLTASIIAIRLAARYPLPVPSRPKRPHGGHDPLKVTRWGERTRPDDPNRFVCEERPATSYDQAVPAAERETAPGFYTVHPCAGRPASAACRTDRRIRRAGLDLVQRRVRRVGADGNKRIEAVRSTRRASSSRNRASRSPAAASKAPRRAFPPAHSSAHSKPEGNGCIERFFRTLKEQLLWVQHFTDVEDLQQALRTFKETYNHQWLIERLGFRAPAVVRRAFALTPAA